MIHQGMAGKIFKCSHCDFSTANNQSLKNHVKRIHLGIRDVCNLKCSYCDVHYKFRCSLIKHKKRCHPSEWAADQAKSRKERQRPSANIIGSVVSHPTETLDTEIKTEPEDVPYSDFPTPDSDIDVNVEVKEELDQSMQLSAIHVVNQPEEVNASVHNHSKTGRKRTKAARKDKTLIGQNEESTVHNLIAPCGRRKKVKPTTPRRRSLRIQNCAVHLTDFMKSSGDQKSPTKSSTNSEQAGEFQTSPKSKPVLPKIKSIGKLSKKLPKKKVVTSKKTKETNLYISKNGNTKERAKLSNSAKKSEKTKKPVSKSQKVKRVQPEIVVKYEDDDPESYEQGEVVSECVSVAVTKATESENTNEQPIDLSISNTHASHNHSMETEQTPYYTSSHSQQTQPGFSDSSHNFDSQTPYDETVTMGHIVIKPEPVTDHDLRPSDPVAMDLTCPVVMETGTTVSMTMTSPVPTAMITHDEATSCIPHINNIKQENESV